MRHVAQQQAGHPAQEGDQLEHSSAGNKGDDNQAAHPLDLHLKLPLMSARVPVTRGTTMSRRLRRLEVVATWRRDNKWQLDGNNHDSDTGHLVGGEAQADHMQVEVGVQEAQRRRLQEEDFHVFNSHS